MSQSIQPATLPIPGRDTEHERQIVGGAGHQESLLQCQRQLLGEALPHEPFHSHRVAVTDETHRFAALTTLSLTGAPDDVSAGSNTRTPLATCLSARCRTEIRRARSWCFLLEIERVSEGSREPKLR